MVMVAMAMAAMAMAMVVVMVVVVVPPPPSLLRALVREKHFRLHLGRHLSRQARAPPLKVASPAVGNE